MNDFLSD